MSADGGADLSGWVVVVTRPEDANGPLSARLRRNRALVLNLPTIEIGPPDDVRPLDVACSGIDRYDWVVFTSARAVQAMAARVSATPSARIASVGPATTAAIEREGWSVAVEGSGAGASGLASDLLDRLDATDRLLFPASAIAGLELTDALLASGCTIDRVVAYETRPRSATGAQPTRPPRADAVTFTSPSAVDGWIRLFGSGPRPTLSSSRVVAIGGTTRERLDAFGVDAHTAAAATLDGVVDRLLELRRECAA